MTRRSAKVTALAGSAVAENWRASAIDVQQRSHLLERVLLPTSVSEKRNAAHGIRRQTLQRRRDFRRRTIDPERRPKCGTIRQVTRIGADNIFADPLRRLFPIRPVTHRLEKFQTGPRRASDNSGFAR